jgi:hypothetical protein
MRMRAPADLASRGDLSVATARRHWGALKERESFELAPYRVQHVERRPVSTSGISLLGFGHRKVTSGYKYTFVRGARGQDVQAGCEQEQDGTDSSFSGELVCHCGSDALELEIGAKAGQGTLNLGGQRYRVTPLRERASGRKSDEPLGYRADGDAPLGAVELDESGRIWTARGLATRDQLVCLFAGVLLFRPITYERRTS